MADRHRLARDRRVVTDAVTKELDLDGVHAELMPDQEVLLVLSAHKNGPVMMVGDGVNDGRRLRRLTSARRGHGCGGQPLPRRSQTLSYWPTTSGDSFRGWM